MTTMLTEVPLPQVAPLPPLIPWWEWILMGLAIASVVLYTASLATAWWPVRRRSERNRRFSGVWGWTMPVMIVLVLGLALVDTRWKDHREDLSYERDRAIDEASVPVIAALEEESGLDITSSYLGSIGNPNRTTDFAIVTLPDGTEAHCDIVITTVDGQRLAALDVDTCDA